MGITRQYQTYYGIHLNHWTERWGGIDYNKILTKTYADDDASALGSTDASSAIEFLYPLLVKNEYYIEGIAEGVFTLFNGGAGNNTVTDFTVTLKKINKAGSSTDLATHQETLGTFQVIGPSDYRSFQFYLNVVKQLVSAEEKLVLRLEITGDTDLRFMHSNDSTEADVWIKIPYVPEEGG